MTLNQIGQIALAVSDTDRSEAFYEHTLGLRKLYRYGALAFFDCAGIRLMLSPPEDGQAVIVAQGAIYFRVADLVLAVKGLRDKGVAIYPWSNTYRFPDPAGALYINWGPTASVQTKFKLWDAPKDFNDALQTVVDSGDQEKRASAFKKALDIYEDEVPATILYNPISTYSMRKGIEWTPYPIYYMDLRPDNLKIKSKKKG